jgi:2-alkenal reductase
MPMNVTRRFALAVLLAAATAALTPLAQRPAPKAAEPRAVSPRGPLTGHEQDVVRLFQGAAPSVAYITTEAIARRGLFAEQVQQGAGSGFVWDELGRVVTNYHVVEGAQKVQVQLDAGRSYDARVIGVAPDYDLAVVQLEKSPAGLKPLAIGTSKDLKIGQTVYAIGNPFGLTRTLTQGIVSALDRELPTSDIREIGGAIQTDAAINPGNSGGPLLDSAGRLIGVTTAIRSPSGGSTGVGLAIPVDLVNRIVPQLITRGKAPQPGIGIVPFHPELVARAGLTGVVISRVAPSSPASQAGLQGYDEKKGGVRDVIIAVNNRPIESLPVFAAELDRVGIDETAELTVVRDGKERRVRVKVIDLAR